MHCLDAIERVEEFIFAALEPLAPGGRLLIGDMPNRDLKARFLSSDFGAEFDRRWRTSAGDPSADPQMQAFRGINMIGDFSDAELLGLATKVRARGFHAYICRKRRSCRLAIRGRISSRFALNRRLSWPTAPFIAFIPR